MIDTIIKAKKINKAKLAKELGFASRTTLYNKNTNPDTYTVFEAVDLAKLLNIDVKDMVQIIIGDHDTFYEIMVMIEEEKDKQQQIQ